LVVITREFEDFALTNASAQFLAAAKCVPLVITTKVSRRLIPFLFALYVAAYLDRINIGFAQLQMKGALGFSDTVSGLGTGIFFIGLFFSSRFRAISSSRGWARACGSPGS
jgi:hypothetical protein